MLDDANHVMLLNLCGELILVLERGKELVLQYGSAKWFELVVTRGETKRHLTRSICHSVLISKHFIRKFTKLN